MEAAVATAPQVDPWEPCAPIIPTPARMAELRRIAALPHLHRELEDAVRSIDVAPSLPYALPADRGDAYQLTEGMRNAEEAFLRMMDAYVAEATGHWRKSCDTNWREAIKDALFELRNDIMLSAEHDDYEREESREDDEADMHRDFWS